MNAPVIAGAAAAAVLALPVGGLLLLAPASSGSCDTAAPDVHGHYTQAEIAQLWVSEHGPADQAQTAGAVGMAESGGDPTIVNRIGAGGLMQIHPPEPDYLVPAVNMRIAVRKWRERGWQPWETYTNGAYLQFMDGASAGAGAGAAPCASGDLGGDTYDMPLEREWLAPLPGMPGEQCDKRIIPNVQTLIRRYHVAVSDCYSADPVHASGGEHPLGLAIDVGPGAGGTWDDVDRLAHDVGWIRACGASGVRPACPLKPWVRFVGYDGYPNHGRGNHLHISWTHGPGRPATTVTVFSGGTT